MLFSHEYSQILSSTDSEYSIPNEKRFQQRKFKQVIWRNIKTKNFSYIIKVLAENGTSTISEIAEYDDLSKNQNKAKNRKGVYSRIIIGSKTDNVVGLITKRLVEEDESVLKSKPTKTFKLTIFGIFYAIHLFSKKIPKIHASISFSEYEDSIFKDNSDAYSQKSILKAIVENYSDALPLIFGKWDLLKNEIKSRLNIITLFAHGTFFSHGDFYNSTLYNSRPLRYKAWNSTQSIYSDEITFWFYSYLSSVLEPRKFHRLLSKDRELSEWYSKYINLLLLSNREDKLRIQYTNFIIKGDYTQAKERWKKINSLQGFDQGFLEHVFDK